jgi:AcrR family transcriptional regulator
MGGGTADVVTAGPARVDGRRARRERGREAVIDATFDLMREGHLLPSVDEVAARAGVSPASVFRYFGGQDDLQRQTIERFLERFAPLFEVPGLGEGGPGERIVRFVDARLALVEAIGPIMRVGRLRALEHPRIAEAVTQTRRRLADQVAVHFAPELAPRSPARADDVVACIDALASVEGWETQHRIHDRSRHQVRRAWIAGIHDLLGVPTEPGPPATAGAARAGTTS